MACCGCATTWHIGRAEHSQQYGEEQPKPVLENEVWDYDVRMVSMEFLVFPEEPVRSRTPGDDLGRLAQSIKASGIIEPIVVRRIAMDSYEIVAGERRARAARLLDMRALPCVVRNCSDEDAVAIGIVENLQRVDLNPIDRARGIRRLHAFGRSQEEIAATLGLSRSSIAHHLRLLSLPDPVRWMIESGQSVDGPRKDPGGNRVRRRRRAC